GAVHVDVRRELLVKLEGDGAEVGPTTDDCLTDPDGSVGIQTPTLRHSRYHFFNDFVGHCVLYFAGGRLEVIARETLQQATIEQVSAVGEGGQGREIRAKRCQLWVEVPQEAGGPTARIEERPVAIGRNGLPDVVALRSETGPAHVV